MGDEIDELAKSFCATIALKIQGKSVRNLFAARVRTVLGKEVDDNDLLTHFQLLWEASSSLEAGGDEEAKLDTGTAPGIWLQAYYEDWVPSSGAQLA